MKNNLLSIIAQIDFRPLPGTEATSGQINTIFAVACGIVAALSLLFIVIGGFRYILSTGDPAAAAQARKTIIYALVGLMVSVSAFAIVRFVIGSTS